MPKHIIFRPAAWTEFLHRRNLAREANLARIACVHVDDLAGSIAILHGTDKPGGLFAFPAVHLVVPTSPKFFIKIQKYLVALWIGTRHRFATVRGITLFVP